MTKPDPTTNTPASASPSASPSASLGGPGHSRVQCVPPSLSPTEGDALNEPHPVRPTSASPTISTGPDWDIFDTRSCRNCGCTHDNACHPPCWWVGYDLCSACTSSERS